MSSGFAAKATEALVLARLEDLGAGAASIAESLTELGVTGRRNDPASCPLAVHLADLAQSIEVDADNVIFTTDDETKVTFSTPSAASEFVRDFDAGTWPDLVEAFDDVSDLSTRPQPDPDTDPDRRW